MTEPTSQPANAPRGVIRRDAVRIVRQPAQIDCGGAHAGQSPIVVVPLLDGDHLAGLEIRCGCGSAAVVECVYSQEA